MLLTNQKVLAPQKAVVDITTDGFFGTGMDILDITRSALNNVTKASIAIGILDPRLSLKMFRPGLEGRSRLGHWSR